MRRILILFVFLLLLFATAGRADQIINFSQKVKTNDDYFYHHADLTMWPGTWAITNVHFVAQDPAPVISPLSNDPRVQTPNPFAVDECRFPSTPVKEIRFFANFKSLKDVGVWRVTFNGTWVNPSCCSSSSTPPCHLFCPTTGVCIINWLEPATFVITVFNRPPTTSMGQTGVAAWNQKVTFNAFASDPDGGEVKYQWRVAQKPPGATTLIHDTTTPNASLPFTSDKDIGFWRVQLDLDDDEGERKTFFSDVTVPNIPPSINITGASSIDVLEDIELGVSQTQDVDGGQLGFSWDILQSPTGASHGPQTNFSTQPILTLPTTEADIGTWKFRVTAKDNENASDSKELTVEVRNLPPEISLTGEHEIDIGDTLQVETTILEDADGGDLTFQWDIIQAPQSSAINVKQSFSTDTSVSIPTGLDDAGTWILRLKAKDNDDSADSEISQDFRVLVDAPVEVAITGPDKIGSFSFPLELSGESSVDPDSPCLTQADRCHNTLEPPVREISPAIASYSWSLVDVPFEV